MSICASMLRLNLLILFCNIHNLLYHTFSTVHFRAFHFSSRRLTRCRGSSVERPAKKTLKALCWDVFPLLLHLLDYAPEITICFTPCRALFLENVSVFHAKIKNWLDDGLLENNQVFLCLAAIMFWNAHFGIEIKFF